jgi:signal peptidase I
VRRDPWLAVNLSFFWGGLGQWYGGYWLKGLGFLVAQALLFAVALWSLLAPQGDTLTALLFLLIGLALYGYNLWDALLGIILQNPQQYPEKIPRQVKNAWFGVVVSRVIPGLGHFYGQRPLWGTALLTAALIGWRLQSTYRPLLVLTPILTALAAASAYRTLTPRRSPWLPLILLGVLLAGLTFNLLPLGLAPHLDRFRLPSSSMAPTLQPGDQVFVWPRDPAPLERGDIVVFRPPPQSLQGIESEAEYFIKRLVALPGETIQIQGGQVYVNGQPLAENYLAETPEYDLKPQTIPPGHYFVLGDNRNQSWDSHNWGPLPQSALVGRAVKIYWPPQRVRSLLPHDP